MFDDRSPHRRETAGSTVRFARARSVIWLTGVAMSLLLGCTSRIHVPYSPEPEAIPAAQHSVSRIFPYQQEPLLVQDRVIRDPGASLYRVRHFQAPSSGYNGQKDDLINALYYQSRLPGKKKLVIVLPIWGSYTYPSEKIAASIRDQSRGEVNVLRILGENYILDWETLGDAPSEEAFVGMLARMLDGERHNVIDISRLIDWAEEQPDLDAGRIGIVGFSHSTLTAALAAANEPRLAATVLVMGGAHPHLIMANCNGRVAELREKIQYRFDWSHEKYLKTMEAVFLPYDPASYPGRVDPGRVLFIDSHKDECMPRQARDGLWQAFDKPERISFRYSHKMSFLAMTPLGFNWMRHRIYEFLDRRLDVPTRTQPQYRIAGN